MINLIALVGSCYSVQDMCSRISKIDEDLKWQMIKKLN